MLPFEVIADGKVIFVVCDVNKLNTKPKASHDVNKPAERLTTWDLKYGKKV